ncbi:hypothetical protein FA13DRAFT_1740212 [Coprinellus micaceus]|uniref:Uncharacterized protein n=1 Tax=Coprinellus micaceus TaxID=71717 RepID=A0A4Y7SNL5_COPMI|nr:hypothetical protein FA13DRAFT_1740212 [Coprinellus micaceus]
MRRAKNAPLIFYASDMVTLPCLEGIKEALSEPHPCHSRCLGPLPLLEKLHRPSYEGHETGRVRPRQQVGCSPVPPSLVRQQLCSPSADRRPTDPLPTVAGIKFGLMSFPGGVTECLVAAKQHFEFSTLQLLVVETCPEIPNGAWRTIFAPMY